MMSEPVPLGSAEDRIVELLNKLNRAECLLLQAASMIHATAPPRVSTRLLIDVRDYVGPGRFHQDVLM